MKKIRQWFRAIIRNLNDYGLTVTSQKIGGYLIKPIYENRACRIYYINLDHEIAIPEIERPNFVFKEIHATDAPAIQQIESMEEWIDGKVRKMLLEDCLCMVAFDKNRVAGFNLVATKTANIPLINLKLPLGAGEAWSVQITVHKSYRRKGLGRDLRFHVFNSLRNKGFSKLGGAALLSNTGSLKLAQRSGFRFKEDIRYIKFLGVKKWIHSEVRK